MHVLVELAPQVRLATAVIGAATLIVAGSSALAQTDIKRILAYSTMSQVGYMFLALGAGAWSAAIFHFVTHAFFKALLFLGAGVIIIGLREEHDIFRMGGLRKQLPLVFWTFLAGAASLSALPLVTAGFYSKEWILSSAWASRPGGAWLWVAGLAGALITVLYAFRLVFVVFSGPERARVDRRPGPGMKVPLIILAVLSLAAGFLETPRPLGNLRAFSRLLERVLPVASAAPEAPPGEAVLGLISSFVVLAGLLLAYRLFRNRAHGPRTAAETARPRTVGGFFRSGWGFDRLYDTVFVKPLSWLARVNRNDALDIPFRGLAGAANGAHDVLSRMQSGRLRWYAAAVALGAILVLAVAVFL